MSPPAGCGTATVDSGRRPLAPPLVSPPPEESDPLAAKSSWKDGSCDSCVLHPTTPIVANVSDQVMNGLLRARNFLIAFSFLSVLPAVTPNDKRCNSGVVHYRAERNVTVM